MSKRVVRRELLDRIARPLLARLLEPYAAFFAARGLALGDLAASEQNDRRLVRRAYDLLHDDPSAVPSELRGRLAAIDALANASGQASLYELCPALAPLRLGAEDAAALAALDHPEAFARARRVVDTGGGLSLTEFDAVSARAPTVAAKALDALRAAFTAWLVARGRSALCALHLRDHGGELHVEIEHGRPPATDDVVGDALDLTQVTLVRTERAHFVFTRATGRLAVQASHAAIKDLLRRLVGEHLFGDAAHFRRDAAYTLAPLAEDLDAALDPTGIPGLEGVDLIGIELATPDETVRRERVGPGDLRAVKNAHQLREMLGGAAVTWCKLRLRLEGRKQPCVVQLSASQKKLAKVSEEMEQVVDDFLVGRGMLVMGEARREEGIAGGEVSAVG